MTADLVEWLTTILKEDKARISSPVFCGGPWPSTGQMLADIAAKRAIIALHVAVELRIEFIHGESGDHWCDVCGSVDNAPVAWPCETLHLLASAYADRPGYREEWRP